MAQNKAIYAAVIELQTLNYIFKHNSMQIVTMNEITEQHFTLYKDHFKFIKNFYDQYKSVPSKETFQAKFGNTFEWMDVKDPDDYLVAKLDEAKLSRDVIVDFTKMRDLIKDEKTDKAVELMAAVSQKYLKQSKAEIVELVENADIRYQNYLEKSKNNNKFFIKTGLEELDLVINGWDVLNDSVVIAGRPGFGKSWWMIFFAMHAAKQGFKVGFYSGEMEPDSIGYRFDTFLGNIPNGALTHGNESVDQQYKTFLESLSNVVQGKLFVLTPEMIGGYMTVSYCRAFMEKHDLDIMFIDQLSLMRDEKNGRNAKEKLDNISTDLRLLQRMMKKPIIMASQLNREDVGEDGPDTKNISGSDKIGQDATIVLFIERNPKENLVKLLLGKSRNSESGKRLTYMWEINKGILHYIPDSKDALGGKPDENSIEEDIKSGSVF